jgi:hypothetical protein
MQERSIWVARSVRADSRIARREVVRRDESSREIHRERKALSRRALYVAAESRDPLKNGGELQ